jgi:hypothetical protein
MKKCQVDKFKQTNRLVGEKAIWQNKNVKKWQLGKMTS